MHCECALLSHLCKHDQPMLPYIGLSRAPCVLCACYVAAYRDYRGFETTMRRAEGRPASTRWICPDFPDRPEDTVAFQYHFNSRLSTYIVRRMLDENVRVSLSKRNQSTSASNVQ
ncbi:uncharacterized protein TRAVEDRAFT_31105 [Trametes versicolor FP-101664 SS1]|uniref:uncharacterized protein n=1 Tax=Trametes versicolor (strain FP-101664) TaxID=717944 RepID=UPI00046224CD|nr:uncharacterized protein TRAVEDRAFT_31105 [Trametes versicolor FP-101664 SS1]EIW55375.1 hypothetical protein TRAVEDRAFT_31105 [Trametes versicolor FP-101664 SS1]